MAANSLTLDANLEALSSISDFVVEQARAAGLDEHAVWEVQLAVDEAATNVIQHSYAEHIGTLSVRAETVAGELRISISDRGVPFNPLDVPEPDLESPLEERKTGGLGLYLMRKLMDRVEWHFGDGENVLLMTKLIREREHRTLELKGRIDAGASPAVNSMIRTAMGEGTKHLIVGLREVTFMSSSGLRTLLLLTRELRRAGGNLVLCEPQPQVAEVFHLTGFDQIFQLHHTREEAAAALGKGS